ncbi:MAG: TAXI family TRAP transporter solute-binding subunit [Alphaproteobacteria bacterium]|mgnify:CR=1 FL=1|nr:TAXI family TRAP transporter solute-binding subunit [Alphaproteobacteria bacterium]HPF48048.1 TAXI family TRAP transporter solute-binding subunit [Emcibacteraceae bacterium]HRW28953.1 TAXI family TRAP transporter solute-binding subunit [Emcibacteraceae bacterium]
MNIFLKKIGLFALGTALILMPLSETFAARKQLRLATGFTGSSMHMFGTVLAKHLQKSLRIRVTAQPYIGPSVFIPVVNSGDVEMGLTSMVDGGTAYAGVGREANKNLRAVARLWAMPFAFMTKKDSGIKTVADLKGKKVVLEVTAAHAINLMAGAMLEAAGLNENDVQVVTVSGVGQGMEAVVEGNADASPGSLRMGVVKKADATVGINVLDLERDGSADPFVSDKAPGFGTYAVKAGEYPGVEKDKLIFAMDIYLMVPASLEDEEVVRILDVLHSEWSAMQKEFSGIATSKLSDFVHASQTFPYHKAAIDYYKNGHGEAIWDDKAEQRNQKLLDIWK